ncbi:hypothetical protein [Aliivibrio fischeri]|uniref:hypothetical protein n=1 Tax=Aliivibrio fischeri TaxID=668 RepID=UPI00105DABA1|nr:hypothetical protein [Aliivibrio fischeri]TDM51489.1 hypothetical protein VFFQA001_15355 [Aliivibrio fischeri]
MTSFKLNAATDKAIFDALNQHKVSKDAMLEMFFSRGVIVSKKTEKEDLAKQYSSYFHNYIDYDNLATILGVNKRKEKLTSFGLSTSITAENVESKIKKIKEEVKVAGCSMEHRVLNSGKTIELTLTYQEFDLSKNDFQQMTTKDAVITIENTDEGLNIRSPLNRKTKEVNNIIIDLLEDIDKDIKREDIQLSQIKSPKVRCEFFETLVECIDGYELVTVTDAYVYNPKKDESENKKDEIHITNASLKGKGVNLSSHLTDLHKKGFYTWKVIWHAVKENNSRSDLYVFEAQFTNAEEFSDFSYMVKGSYKRKDTGIVSDLDGYNVNRTPVLLSEENTLNKLLEDAARLAIVKLTKSLGEDDSDDDSKKQVVLS